MSQENAEIVRRFLEALDRRDYARAMPCLHEDAEWHNTAAFPGARMVTGPEAIVEFWQALVESFDQVEGGTAVESITVSGDRVVAEVHSQGRGAGSGVPVDVYYALSFSLRKDRIARVVVSGDYVTALEAAGLRE